MQCANTHTPIRTHVRMLLNPRTFDKTSEHIRIGFILLEEQTLSRETEKSIAKLKSNLIEGVFGAQQKFCWIMKSRNSGKHNGNALHEEYPLACSQFSTLPSFPGTPLPREHWLVKYAGQCLCKSIAQTSH